MEHNSHKANAIKGILTVLGGAVVCAGLITSVFLYYYGPSGSYIAGHALLDPLVIEEINAQEFHTRKRQNVHFIFEKMEFSYFDDKLKKAIAVPVSLQDYQKFYQIVSGERSLAEVSREVENLFVKSFPTALSMTMKTLEGASAQAHSELFQIIQFVEEDYFRVQLHGGPEKGGWAYFYKNGLYPTVMQIFTIEEPK